MRELYQDFTIFIWHLPPACGASVDYEIWDSAVYIITWNVGNDIIADVYISV